MRKYTKRVIMLSCIFLLVLMITVSQRKLSVFSDHYRFQTETLIIDPGHGGEDGGAVSVSGKSESQVNLSVALHMDALLGFYGVHTILTRTSDISIYDPDAKTLRQKKVSDIHNRVNLIESVENATLISIHQNSYTSPNSHGMQVFYANPDSIPLAQIIQEHMYQTLDQKNQRIPLKIPKTVYLMNHITCPAVLVECGFLSNPTEDLLLQTAAYQRQLAAVLAASYLNFQQGSRT